MPWRGPLRSLAVRLTLVVVCAMVVLVTATSIWRTFRLFDETMTEVESSQRLAHAAIPHDLAEMRTSATPDEAVRRLIERFEGARHIAVVFHPMNEDGSEPAAPAMANGGWFSPSEWPEPVIRNAVFRGERIGTFFVLPRPDDEIEERRELILSDLVVTGFVTAAFTILTFWAVRRAMRPLRRVSESLIALGNGDLSARLEPMNLSEFGQLPEDFNRTVGMIRDATSMREKLTDTLITVEEATRRRFAHDLHDELSPYLVAIQPNIALLESALERDPALAPYEGSIRAVSEHVSRTVQRVRLMLETLHPPELDSLGLIEAVREFCETQRLAQPGQLTFGLDLDPKAAGCSESIDTTVFRTVQESVTNALKHGGCRHIDVSLRREDTPGRGTITLRIWNDGTSEAPRATRGGLGSLGLQDRVDALGGSSRIGPAPAAGWLVDVSIPLPADTESAR